VVDECCTLCRVDVRAATGSLASVSENPLLVLCIFDCWHAVVFLVSCVCVNAATRFVRRCEIRVMLL
jgi:hypothetical protein